MGEELNLWRLAAGLGLFLFGMHQLEQALTRLAGRRFKEFLAERTEVSRGELSEVEISTLLNVNRELLVASHSLVAALVDALLNMDAASDFASLPAAR